MLSFFTAHFSRPKVPNLGFFKGFLELPSVDITRCLTNQPVCFQYPPKFNIWNPKMMVSKFGISSKSADFQVNHSGPNSRAVTMKIPTRVALLWELNSFSQVIGFFRIVGICKSETKTDGKLGLFFEGAPEKNMFSQSQPPTPASLHTATMKAPDGNPPETWMR